MMDKEMQLMVAVLGAGLLMMVGALAGAGIVASHMSGGEVDSGMEIDEIQMKNLVSLLNWHGGTIYTDDGKTIPVASEDTVVEERGMIKVSHGSYGYYIPPYRIVAVYT